MNNISPVVLKRVKVRINEKSSRVGSEESKFFM